MYISFVLYLFTILTGYKAIDNKVNTVVSDPWVTLDSPKIVYLSLHAGFALLSLGLHHTFPHRLKHHLGILGTVLDWIESYLTDRSQYVATPG